MRAKWNILLIIAICLAMIAGCSDSGDNNADGDSELERDSCNQATDCGTGGLASWVCSPEGLCYSVAEYCIKDDECNGACIDHLCENGKFEPATDGDNNNNTDGDQVGGDPDQVVCQYQCCTDADCPSNNFCDTNTHTCVLIVDCDKECCQDWDCENDPNFGEGYICRLNRCVDENNPCTTECCSQEDCTTLYGEGYICDAGTCREDIFACQPGWKICCTEDPGNPDCIDLGDLGGEAILTCNAAGDAYEVSMCDPFNDCLSDGLGGIECFPNGRCEVSDDCDCPKQCIDTVSGLRCRVPLVGDGELCAQDLCTETSGSLDTVGNCDSSQGLICCIGIDQNDPDNGYCTPEANCSK